MNTNNKYEKNPIFVYLFLIAAVGAFIYFSTDRTKYYTVSFETNGGSKIAHLNLEEGEVLEKPNNPTSEYCSEFTGWYTDPNFENEYNFNNPIFEDVTLYAGWSMCTRDLDYIKYKVTFNSNGGSSVETQEVFNKQTASAPSNITHSKCSTFTGWYTDSTLKKKYNFSSPVTSNITLYAGWDNCKDYSSVYYTVSFDTNEGSEIEEQMVLKNSKVLTPEDPTKYNCSFSGWYKDKDLKNKYDFNTKVTNNITIYAKWNCNKEEKPYYTVVFDTLSDTKIEPQIIASGGKINKPKNPTIKDCTFQNWYTNEKDYGSGFDFNTPVTRNITLKAHYACYKKQDEKIYTVKFENYGKFDIPDVYVKENEKLTRPSDPTDKWCKFAGWYSDENLTKSFDFNTLITKDTTIYLKWINCTSHVQMISILFDANGGEIYGRDTMSAQVSYGSTLSEPATPEKQWCSFGGWYKDSELKQKYKFDTPVTSSFTLYAKWQYCTGNN